MVDTTLPYEMTKLNDIRENGAHVRLVDADFSKYTSEDNTFTTMVYLRNTNFTTVELDFSGVPYDHKEKMMLIYMREDMKIDNHEFSDALYDILFTEVNNTHQTSNVMFTHDEICRFVDNNRDYVNEYLIYVKSLSLYMLTRVKALNDIVINDIETVDDDVDIGNNILNVIKNTRFDQLSVALSAKEDIPLKFYTKDFTLENNDLFDALRRTTYGFLIDALMQEAREYAD